MKYMNKGAIFFGTIVLAMIFFMVMKKVGPHTEDIASREELCGMTGGMYSEDSCQCGNVLSIYNSETGRCEDMNGRTVDSSAQYHFFVNRYHFVTNCSRNKYDIYVVPGEALSFCYDTTVANPKMAIDTKEFQNADVVEMLDQNLDLVARVSYLKASDPTIWEEDALSWCVDCSDRASDSVSLEQILSELGIETNETETSVQPFYTIESSSGTSTLIPFIDTSHHVYIDTCADVSVCDTIREHIMSDTLLFEKNNS